jgi:preprotein translocase subunit SecE
MGVKKSNKKSKAVKATAANLDVAKSEGGLANAAKWIVVVLLLVAAVYADYHYFDGASGVITKANYIGMKKLMFAFARVFGWLLMLAATLGLAATTKQGGLAWSNLKKARNEMYRVTWPTREETVKMAVILICIVIFMAVLLWVIDFGYLKLTSFFVRM